MLYDNVKLIPFTIIYFSSPIQTIALKNQGVYSALSVVIHIYGYAQIGTGPRLDGARSDFFLFQILCFKKYSILLVMKYGLIMNETLRHKPFETKIIINIFIKVQTKMYLNPMLAPFKKAKGTHQTKSNY